MSSQAEKKPKETMKFYVLAIITLLIGNVIGYLSGALLSDSCEKMWRNLKGK